MIAYLKAVRYPTIGNGLWDSTGTVVSNAYDIDVSLSIGNLNDTMNFSIANTKNLVTSTWNINDKVDIHLLFSGETYSSSNIIFTGIVKNISETYSEKSKVLEFNCVSLGEVLTTGIVTANNTNVDVMQHLQSCLNSISRVNDKFVVTWDSSNPTLKQDGVTAFPKINGGGYVTDFNVSFNTVIEKYLTDKYMQDGNYYWYVSTENKLVIRPRTNTSLYTLNEGVDFINMKYTYDPQIYNWIHIKCGFDPANRPISTFQADYTSIAKYGQKYYMLVNNQIAEDIMTAEGLTTSTNVYPSSYPHVCSWKDENGNTVTATNDNDFRNKFREQAKVAGKSYAQKFISMNSGLRKKFTLILTPSRNYTLGTVITVNAPSYNMVSKKMRITDIQYSGINTILTVKEDLTL